MATLKLTVNTHDHHAGDSNGSLTLVEYGDFQCSCCRRAYSLIKRLLKKRNNDIHFIFRNFPLRQVHHHAYAAAATAGAAGKQGKFWEMHDLIFENQHKLNAGFLMSLAQDVGLDAVQFAIDKKSDEVQKKIEADFEGGIQNGVNRTPTFFLNDIPILTYDGTYESLSEAIRLELNVKQNFLC